MGRTDELGIYLADHYTGAAGGVELARRAAAARREDPAGEVLARIAAQIGEDQVALQEIMASVGAPVPRVRAGVAWLGEKVTRLKPNGRLLSRSPLSDYLELEALLIGVRGKEAGWRTLRALAERDRRLPAAALDELVARAQQQVADLEGLRDSSREHAFGS